jgi:arylformamidase
MNPNRKLSTCPPDSCQAQYFLRGVIPEFPQILAQWQADAKATRAALRCETDLQYGPGPLCRLDLFPAAQENAPLLVFLHGGYWQGGDKGDISFVVRAFVEHGIAVAIPNYSLAPQASIFTMLDEARAAFEWLAAHAHEWHIDSRRIFAAGHSAGGQLAAMMLTDAWAPKEGDRAIVQQAFAVSGLYDLRPLQYTGLNDALKLNQETAAQLSPVDHLQTGGRLHPIVGELETREFHVQAALIEASWPRVAPPLVVPDVQHYAILYALADAGSELFRTIAREMTPARTS